ncbi:MAG: hypothetical protein HPM95_04065 [Alphaproteobacteria bacterium]|nr:hypothetical protein [Alphaproteobacteria bacterium]
MLDTLGDVVTRWREGGDVVYANDAALKLFPDGRIDALHAPAADEGPAGYPDIRIETASGPRWFARRDVAVRDGRSGEPLIQTILRDVTDRRQIEDALVAARNQAETASASKSRFLATVSHEIRTPLNGILGMAGLLRDTRLTAEQRSYVEAVRSSGEILLLLISEVLDMSKIEAGRLDLAPAPTDIALLAESVVELLSPRAQTKGARNRLFRRPGTARQTCRRRRAPQTDPVQSCRKRPEVHRRGRRRNRAGKRTRPVRRWRTPAGDQRPRHRYRLCRRRSRAAVRGIRADRPRTGAPLRRRGSWPVHLAPAGATDGRRDHRNGRGRLRRLFPRHPTARAGAADIPRHTAVPVGRRVGLAGKTIVLVTRSRVEGPLIARRLQAEGARAQLIRPATRPATRRLPPATSFSSTRLPSPTPGPGLPRAGGRRYRAGHRADHTGGARAPSAFAGGRLRRLSHPPDPLRLPGAGGPRGSGARRTQAAWDLLRDDRSEDRPDPERSAPTRLLRLLVADDNDINRMLTEALVRKLGHEPVVVSDGAEALDAVRCNTGFDILFDGSSHAGRRRPDRDPAVPGAGTSGAARARPGSCGHRGRHAGSRGSGVAAGADAVLTKPIDPELLAGHLRGVARPPADHGDPAATVRNGCLDVTLSRKCRKVWSTTKP